MGFNQAVLSGYIQWMPFVIHWLLYFCFSFSLIVFCSLLSTRLLLYTQWSDFALYSVVVFCPTLSACLFGLFPPVALCSKLNCCFLLCAEYLSFVSYWVATLCSILSACFFPFYLPLALRSKLNFLLYNSVVDFCHILSGWYGLYSVISLCSELSGSILL